MNRARRLLFVLVLIGAAGAGYYYTTLPPVELVLTSIVTTNDVLVGPQVAGRLTELTVNEGDRVTRGQLIGVIAPDELRAESAYATHNLEGLASQIQQSQAELRYEERQTTEQIRQAETNLSAIIAQQAASLADLEAVITVTSFALISMMFLIMVRVSDPLLPRAIFGVLNTLLYFPSGAVYPQQGFPRWMQWLAAVDPFTYAVHAFKSLVLKNTGFGAISFDLLFLTVFSIVAMSAATMLFKRTL